MFSQGKFLAKFLVAPLTNAKRVLRKNAALPGATEHPHQQLSRADSLSFPKGGEGRGENSPK
jgi:hypothetical protein